MPTGGIVILVILFIAMTAFCLYGLWAIWPTGGSAKSASVVIFGRRFSTTTDEQLFAVVALAGALGGLVHSIRSLSWYVGNRNLRWSWIPFCVLLPVVGAAGGTVFYIVSRAGLISSSNSGTRDLNAYGFAAVAVLVGLFSEQAVLKLKSVAASVFSESESGVDHTPASGGSGAS